MNTVTVRPEQCVELLQRQWEQLRDDASELQVWLARQSAFVFELLGVLSTIECEGWIARFERCPGHEGEGGRTWCAYCGEMHPTGEDA